MTISAKLSRAIRDDSGASALEFALLLPAFSMLLLGMSEGGVLLWTQLGLQHGAEMAARCASINTALCGATDAVQNYAAQQSYGLNPLPAIFNVSTSSCGSQVSASYTYTFLSTTWGSPSITLNAYACFPK